MSNLATDPFVPPTGAAVSRDKLKHFSHEEIRDAEHAYNRLQDFYLRSGDPVVSFEVATQQRDRMIEMLQTLDAMQNNIVPDYLKK
jgi:hypothetical protein